ncbi:WG repeat-containing protein [Gelidibacter japonicus]|uniref:WG repeat-containing protein n=1 Tax=Gelidibacter japonicus TaxID=1962232 RepID=UPI00202113FC|nr:WG repeat-containing protein [Gelidibacter japonicus]MCL8006891.1 WG repeat-containing protein [Gelidibacter japonicus]
MKRSYFLIFITVFFTTVLYSQNIDNADFVSPMNDGMVAVKKGNQWGFINSEGNVAINFRNDLVVSTTADGSFPIFQNGRCLITQKKDGIDYYGYIDHTGKTVIEPQYLNATNFKDNVAIVLVLRRNELSQNIALNKPVVNYDYFEVAINLEGEVITYLTQEPVHITLSAEKLRKPPVIYSKALSNTLFAVMNPQKKWSILKVE